LHSQWLCSALWETLAAVPINYNRIVFEHTDGHASEFFKVTRGIRQGCPISAMLFLLVVELLSAVIKKSPNIEGLHIGDETFVITQLADDTTLFVKDDKSIRCLMQIMESFMKQSIH